MIDILKKDGLSEKILEELSYQSWLGINLKKNLHYFEERALLGELENVNKWYIKNDKFSMISADYRIKSIQSIRLKYRRYYPDRETRKVFNDLLGFRSLCDSYDDVLELSNLEHFRVADMSKGKRNDDGYRGVHVYFQLSNFHYPIEIQYNTYHDRQFNNWLHKYLYKKSKNNEIGRSLREDYDTGRIKTEKEFKEALEDVLSSSKEVQ